MRTSDTASRSTTFAVEMVVVDIDVPLWPAKMNATLSQISILNRGPLARGRRPMKPAELVNRQWILARVPDGPAREGDFAQRTIAVEELADGEALGRARWFTSEAAMRAWLAPPASRDGAAGSVPARGYPFRVQP